MAQEQAGERRREYRDKLIGLAGAAVLTAASFLLVVLKPVSRDLILAGLGALALAQIGWQFRFFLDIDLRKSHRDDLQLVLFTGLIVALMIGGSLWILFNQHARMG